MNARRMLQLASRILICGPLLYLPIAALGVACEMSSEPLLSVLMVLILRTLALAAVIAPAVACVLLFIGGRASALIPLAVMAIGVGFWRYTVEAPEFYYLLGRDGGLFCGIAICFVGWLMVVCIAANGLDSHRLPRPDRGLCRRCGYNLTGNASGVCPECGTAVGVQPDS